MRERASLLPRQVRRADSRIRDAKAVRGVSGVGSTWASYIIGERARKLHKHDPLRCDLLSRLEMMADAAEAAPVPAALQVYMGSPALHKAVEAQETAASAALGPRRQGRRDRGSCVWIVCLRRVPFAPCMWYDLGARSCAPASSTVEQRAGSAHASRLLRCWLLPSHRMTEFYNTFCTGRSRAIYVAAAKSARSGSTRVKTYRL